MVSSLFAIRDYYVAEVLAETELQCPAEDERLDDYRLAQPAAHVGWIPPGGVLTLSGKIAVPCIVVGLDKRTSSDEDSELNLRITAAIYDPGQRTYTEKGALQLEPNFEGYVTLLNLLDRLESATLKNRAIAGRYTLSSDVETVMYEEQPFPYWYGFLRFKVTGEGYPQTRYAELLN